MRYIVGYPDKTVHPQSSITRAEVATIFFRLLTEETRTANATKTNNYADVSSDNWYNQAVSTLSAMGIIKGDSRGNFNPNAPITPCRICCDCGSLRQDGGRRCGIVR